LHPSMHVYYLKIAEWEGIGIVAAIKIAEKCWATHYKLTPSKQVAAPEMLQFAYSKVRAPSLTSQLY